MTRLEKIKLAIEQGFTYNSENGKIFSRFNKEIKNKSNYGYIRIKMSLSGKRYFLLAHQFAYYIINNKIVDEIDHINGIRTDNRILNLREVSSQENKFNMIDAKGYCWSEKRRKWVAQIGVNYKVLNLGGFNTEIDAKQAYLNAKNKYHIIGE
jgi:hypothetical protein